MSSAGIRLREIEMAATRPTLDLARLPVKTEHATRRSGFGSRSLPDQPVVWRATLAKNVPNSVAHRKDSQSVLGGPTILSRANSPAMRLPGSLFVPPTSVSVARLLRMSENAGRGMLTDVSDRITSRYTCWISPGVWNTAGRTANRSYSVSTSLGSDASCKPEQRTKGRWSARVRDRSF